MGRKPPLGSHGWISLPERRETAEAVSKVWIETSDGEHSRLLLLFTTSSRKREHVWREFGGVPEGNFLRSDF